MTVAEDLLLTISVAVFVYLGVAMFRPERRPETKSQHLRLGSVGERITG